MSELSKKFSKLTGLNYDIDNLINNATTAEQKKVLYDKLMWDIKNGLIRGVDGIKELVQFVLPKLAEALSQPSTAEVVEDDPTKYTQSEADAYNLSLPNSWARERTAQAEDCNELNTGLTGILMYGAVKENEVLYTEQEIAEHNATQVEWEEGKVKTPAVEAQDAVLYEDAEEYNTAKRTQLTDEQFEALDTSEKIKTPAVAAQDAVLYTEQEIAAHNEALDIWEAPKVKSAAVYYENSEVTANNTNIEGAVKIGDQLTDAQVYAHNATLPGAVHKGDVKPAQTNNNQEQNNQEG